MPRTPVYLELGKRWVFACALDWPGWCRRGKGEHAALDTLAEYAARYAAVVGPGFDPGELTVVERVAGDATTDFGAPRAMAAGDADPLTSAAARRQVGLLEASWRAFDALAAGAPPELRKGPRGGGRDRDAIVDHVREAERAYARKIGARVPPRTPWPDQRAVISAALSTGRSSGEWPARYALRRLAWHVLDHLWEIEDRLRVDNV